VLRSQPSQQLSQPVENPLERQQPIDLHVTERRPPADDLDRELFAQRGHVRVATLLALVPLVVWLVVHGAVCVAVFARRVTHLLRRSE